MCECKKGCSTTGQAELFKCIVEKMKEHHHQLREQFKAVHEHIECVDEKGKWCMKKICEKFEALCDKISCLEEKLCCKGTKAAQWLEGISNRTEDIQHVLYGIQEECGEAKECQDNFSKNCRRD